jgi:hypothetical protein
MTYRIPWLYGILLLPVTLVAVVLLCVLFTILAPIALVAATLTGNLTYTTK